jgi:CBS domain-containing protein
MMRGAETEEGTGGMRASDLMTTAVVAVTPGTPVADIAHLLADRGISAVPVLGPAGELLGIVTEADLLRRVAGEPENRGRGWFATLLAGRAGAEAERYARLHGDKARDVMTTDLVTVEEDTPAEEIARLMEERRVKRVPVLRADGRRLAGIVSRADLLGLLLSPPAAAAEVGGRPPDERIRRAVEAAMRGQPWADTYMVYPEVRDGVVTFHGFCRSEAVPKALRVLAERVPGVRGVAFDLQPPPIFALGVP